MRTRQTGDYSRAVIEQVTGQTDAEQLAETLLLTGFSYANFVADVESTAAKIERLSILAELRLIREALQAMAERKP